jgi:hypothetical protein
VQDDVPDLPLQQRTVMAVETLVVVLLGPGHPVASIASQPWPKRRPHPGEPQASANVARTLRAVLAHSFNGT